MATIREWLNKAGFDWNNGIIIYQKTPRGEAPGWNHPVEATKIQKDHPILDKEFHNSFGAPECPRFIAKDNEAIYFPVQYDGATWIDKVYLDITKYLDVNFPTPYPGKS